MRHATLFATAGLLAAVTGAASAKNRGYVAPGVEVGNGADVSAATALDLGGRLGESHWFVHGQVAFGRATDLVEWFDHTPTDSEDFMHGELSFLRARVGVERFTCSAADSVCLIYGLDLGGLVTSASSGIDFGPPAHYQMLQVVPRVGLDWGNERLRLRLTLAAPLGLTIREQMQTTDVNRGPVGEELAFAVAYRL